MQTASAMAPAATAALIPLGESPKTTTLDISEALGGEKARRSGTAGLPGVVRREYSHLAGRRRLHA